MKKIWADTVYGGDDLKAVSFKYGKNLEVVKRPAGRVQIYNEEWKVEWISVDHGFIVLPKQWVLERIFAWIGRYRRRSKDYERHRGISRMTIYLSMTRMMLKCVGRLTNPSKFEFAFKCLCCMRLQRDQKKRRFTRARRERQRERVLEV